MPQRNMQDMMRHKADLVGKAKKVKFRPIGDDLTLCCRRSRSVAVSTPEAKDGQCGIGLSKMGDSLRGARRVERHGSPMAWRSAA